LVLLLLVLLLLLLLLLSGSPTRGWFCYRRRLPCRRGVVVAGVVVMVVLDEVLHAATEAV